MPPLRRSLPRPPGASLPPRRGDSRSGRRRLRRPLPLLLLLLLLLLLCCWCCCCSAAAAAAARAVSAQEQAAARRSRTRSPRRPCRVGRPRAAPFYSSPATTLPSQLSACLPEGDFQKQELQVCNPNPSTPGFLPTGSSWREETLGLLSRDLSAGRVPAAPGHGCCLQEPPCDRSPQSWPGDEPRGGPREESGGDVHSAEGPSAAHAEEDGLQCAEDVVMAFSRSETEDRRQ
ncbi:beta-catenin-interacting protein 1 isoform X2 [Sus scrofa]|uniref:beta-catenin-interacting protein 1 isoform X2 n=1 Tax=Sus scrofa TaxID=9823 RepID=UPI000A2B990B|nr:beta-catenin-interacting protein 1 isoform X2 [Sus scrofa]